MNRPEGLTGKVEEEEVFSRELQPLMMLIHYVILTSAALQRVFVQLMTKFSCFKVPLAQVEMEGGPLWWRRGSKTMSSDVRKRRERRAIAA
jgi:hypothetical protein